MKTAGCAGGEKAEWQTSCEIQPNSSTDLPSLGDKALRKEGRRGCVKRDKGLVSEKRRWGKNEPGSRSYSASRPLGGIVNPRTIVRAKEEMNRKVLDQWELKKLLYLNCKNEFAVPCEEVEPRGKGMTKEVSTPNFAEG